MEYSKISGTELNASRVGLGTWAIGGWLWGGTDEREAIGAIHAALDGGINLIDTAPVYGFGRSEEIVGKALAEYGRREKIILATKTGLEWSGGKVFRNASRERILHEIEDSLRRLGTTYVDIYQVHWPDPLTPIEETAGAMGELLQSGKIRAIGVSNYSPEQMDRFRKITSLHSVQPPYNLFEREIDEDVLPYAHLNHISTIVYGALCRGLLSGRMRPDTAFTGDDVRKMDPKFQPPRYAQYLAAAERLAEFARKTYGKTLLELAVRWTLDQPGVTTALWGARRAEQRAPLEGVFGWKLDEAASRAAGEIVREAVKDPAGPEFMAPPVRSAAAQA
jgi:aryl-alcohol dehydrogenase-like predicted oxidoreductase